MRQFLETLWHSRRAALLVLAVFAVSGFVHMCDQDGDDLSASYLGCQVIAAGRTSHLYAHDPKDFSIVDDPAWDAAAEAGAFDGHPHPYVQTPLWAWSLQPVCTRVHFDTFKRLFAALAMVCFAMTIWLVAWAWTPDLLSTGAFAAIALALWFSTPFRYALDLTQTHILYLTMTLASLILAERKRPGWAGLLLAGAAAVKLTPGVLVVYWALTRRWKAVFSAAAWSLALWLAGYIFTGPQAISAYLADIHRISRILLVSFNNQSLAAWWMGHRYPGEIENFHMLPLPTGLQLASTFAMVTVTAFGGLIDRQARHRAPLGAMMALLAATTFAPINWTHYAIVLIAPLMVLVHEARRGVLRPWLTAGVVAVVALSFPPLARDLAHRTISPLSLVRSEFYSETLCLALLAAAWARTAPDRNHDEAALVN